jgi:aspartate racemase
MRARDGAMIGLVGGMSWESTVPYYRVINEAVRDARGGLHSARIVLYSVDFHEIESMQRDGRWTEAGDALAQAARALEGAGADFRVLCTTTMHKVAAAIEAAVRIPLLHIAVPTADAIEAADVRTVGLLGTRFTMDEPFYRERLAARGLAVLLPDAADRDMVNRVIYDELCMGRIVDASRVQYRRVIDRLVADGAEGIIFGCTEIAMLIGAADAPVPTFDTIWLHARAAAARALRPPCPNPRHGAND